MGEIKLDSVTRLLYSTDASIYQVEPLGVLFPRSVEDLAAAVSLAARYGLPLLARGSGSSLAGQAVGQAVILDCARHLNRCLAINPEEGWADVEPGLILAALNRRASAHGLQFGPDPASAERATLGGCIANNAAGAHSILHGMTADHVLETGVILADGSQASFGPVSLAQAEERAQNAPRLEARLYRAALDIRQHSAEAIRQRWPKTWRRSAGYNLNYLLPWSSTQPPLWQTALQTWRSPAGGWPYPPIRPGELNLSSLLTGSEGTLAVLQRARLRLVALPAATLLAVLPYASIAAACDAVPALLELAPSAVELIPRKLVELARSVPAYASQLSFVEQLSTAGQPPEALLVVEFSADSPQALRKMIPARFAEGPVYWAETAEAQRQVWAVRKVGLGILMSQPGSLKPIAFIEDMGVPVDRLGEFVRAMDKILQHYDTQAEIYAHASAGCLHIRPLIDLKTGQGRQHLRAIAAEAVALTLSLGGSTSAEHGDGLARSEWLEQAYGSEIAAAFRQLKEAADPDYLLNPGKIVNPPPMDTQLRYGPSYVAQAWQPELDFHQQGAAGLTAAVEQCNGAGVCRKADGVMCPSFQASQDEMHSTRGRANLLRAMLSGQFPSSLLAEKAVKEALDLCLACKGCRAECPSGVDMARLKYEFLDHYYQPGKHAHPLRDYLFGYLELFARLGQPFAGLVNPLMQTGLMRSSLEKLLGLSRQRPFPALAGQTLSRQRRRASQRAQALQPVEKVFFLVDAFGEFFHPAASLSALRLLEQARVEVLVLPGYGAGRTLISKGFLAAARRRAQAVLAQIARLDPAGELPVLGVEPSEIYTLRDEYPDLFPADPALRSQAASLAGRAWTVEEFLIRPGSDQQPRFNRAAGGLAAGQSAGHPGVLLHGHCYQKTQPPAPDGHPVGAAASAALLRMAGFSVQQIEAGCCGMAGAFGYEAEHFQFSTRVAELKLLPAIRAGLEKDPAALLAASGVSCQAQLQDLGGVLARHPLELVSDAACNKHPKPRL